MKRPFKRLKGTGALDGSKTENQALVGKSLIDNARNGRRLGDERSFKANLVRRDMERLSASGKLTPQAASMASHYTNQYSPEGKRLTLPRMVAALQKDEAKKKDREMRRKLSDRSDIQRRAKRKAKRLGADMTNMSFSDGFNKG